MVATRTAPLATNRRHLEKDTPDLDNMLDHRIYLDGPWSYCENEVISSVVGGGSNLLNFIPSRGVNWRQEHIQHLVWVKPDGYDPSAETYGDYLAGLDDLEDCDFGPSPNWGACEYMQEFGTVSFQSKTLTDDDLNIKECRLSPIYTNVNRTGGRVAIANDAEWAVAQVGLVLEQHLDWNVIYGDPAVYKLTYDGLDKVISPGFVNNHKVGEGDCKFTDPIVLSGLGLGSDMSTLISTVRAVVTKILKRAADRNYRITQQDIALVMPSAHWAYVADALACNGLASSGCDANITIFSSAGDMRAERARIATGGPFGEGTFPTGSFDIGVITDNLLGYNTLVGGNPAVTGDWYILTRRFAGINILEHQFLDWNEVFNVETGARPQWNNKLVMQNGMIKQGWKITNDVCYQAYLAMEGRLISRYQPLQAKIQDITIETFLENENESVNFASLDWYAE